MYTTTGMCEETLKHQEGLVFVLIGVKLNQDCLIGKTDKWKDISGIEGAHLVLGVAPLATEFRLLYSAS